MEIFGILQIRILWNFSNWKFLEFSKSENFGTFQTGNCWNFPNWKFLGFFKLEFLRLFQIIKFTYLQNFIIWKFNKFLEFFQFGKRIFLFDSLFSNSLKKISFDLLEHSKYMMIYQIGNFWNFPNRTFFEFFKLEIGGIF